MNPAGQDNLLGGVVTATVPRKADAMAYESIGCPEPTCPAASAILAGPGAHYFSRHLSVIGDDLDQLRGG